jgi:hypothetical protein
MTVKDESNSRTGSALPCTTTRLGCGGGRRENEQLTKAPMGGPRGSEPWVNILNGAGVHGPRVVASGTRQAILDSQAKGQAEGRSAAGEGCQVTGEGGSSATQPANEVLGREGSGNWDVVE